MARKSSAKAAKTRKLLIHYHLFKNAGTSVDAILEKNFGDRWVNTEFPPHEVTDHQTEIRAFIAANPNLLAMSSHTLMLPVPEIDGVEIFPILFVRHPLDRMKSAYDFERTQDADTDGTRFARVNDFSGYVRARLGVAGDRSCREFQVERLAMEVTPPEGTEKDRALMAVDRLPFVGLVEDFEGSIRLLERLVKPLFPEFRGFVAQENSAKERRGRTLEERLQAIRAEMGDEFYTTVLAVNEGDIAVRNRVQEKLQRSLSGKQDVAAKTPA